MNKPPNSNQTPIQLILRAQLLAQQDVRSEQGYAMVITSIVSIALLSMLAAYATMSNLSKSSTNAYVDGTNSFYVAESGLNKRASELYKQFETFKLPTGTNPAGVSNCFSKVIATNNASTYDLTNDFECRNYRFRHGNSAATLKSSGGSTEVADTTDNVNYVAYTFVKPNQNYATTPATLKRIDTNQPFAGLNALEYKYIVYSTAKKPNSVNFVASTATNNEITAKGKKIAGTANAAELLAAAEYDSKQAVADTANAGSSADASNTNIVLQMDFNIRAVPLFQFAAFYEDDLEMDSQMPMSVSGPIHTNGNLRAISYSLNNDTTVDGKTSADFTPTNLIAGTQLLGKVTAAESIYERVVSSSDFRPGGCGKTKNCGVMAVYKGGTLPLNERASYYYFPDFNSASERTTALTSSEITGFGDRMQDRTKGVARLNPPQPGFLRESNYKTTETGLYYAKADLRLKYYPNRSMPFDLTPIKAGSGCDLTTNKIPTDRQGSAALSCTALTKGELRSLQQPVLTRSTLATITSTQQDVLKALRVAIAASNRIVPLSKLDQTTISLATLKTTRPWVSTFETLLISISGYENTTAGNTARNLLLAKTPKQLVEELGSKFLPAPIQAVGTTSSSPSAYIPTPLPSPLLPATTPDDDGNVDFCNTLKSPGQTTNSCTPMQLLQTNIASLTYWNRDGIYVEANSNVMTTPYAAPTSISLSSGLSTDNKAFIKMATADTSKPTDSFAYNGLAAADRTEGGLVIHATVSDDTDGISGNETTATDANKVPGKRADGSINPYVDNYRIYTSGGDRRKSPYGFVWSGGEELPAPLTIATDQAAYIQGDYNNPGVTRGSIPKSTQYRPSNDAPTAGNLNPPGYYRQPASIVADTITVLSNQCENVNKQVNCGIINGTARAKPQVTNGIAINAAFLSNLIKSGGTQATYNGGLNKYMRLLENWSGPEGAAITDRTYYNYTGSMVSLGEPLESDKLADGSGVPNRNFNYESRFDSFDKLPPLNPTAIYLQQDVFRRKY